MQNVLSYVKCRTAGLPAVLSRVVSGAITTLTDSRGEGFVDTAIKILMAVVIGALVLAGLYALFGDTVLPTLVNRIQSMFNFTG